MEEEEKLVAQDAIYNPEYNDNLISLAEDQLSPTYQRQEAIFNSPYDEDVFASKIFGFTTQKGEDVYQELFNEGKIDFNSPSDTIMRGLASKQSAPTKAVNFLTQFVGGTAVNVVANLVGAFYSTKGLLTEGVEGIYNNPEMQAFDQLKEDIKEANPVFYDPSKWFGPNMKTLMAINEGLQFSLGIVLSEMAAAAATEGMSVTTLFPRIAKNIGYLGKIIDGASDVASLQKKIIQAGGTAEEIAKLKNVASLMKTADATTQMARRFIIGTNYEAGLEARLVHEELEKKLYDQLEENINNLNFEDKATEEDYRQQEKEKIDKRVEQAGFATYALNSAFLSVSNAIQFPTLFGSSYFAKNLAGDVIRTGLGTARTKTAKELLARNIWRVVERPLVEMNEEMTQRAISTGASTYYEDILGIEANTGVLAQNSSILGNAITKGLYEAYGTKDGWFEGLVGATVGAIGVPFVPGLMKKTGVYGALTDIQNEKTYIQETVDALNTHDFSNILKYNRDNAILASLDAQREELAVATQSPLEFESAQDNKVFRYVTDRLNKNLGSFIKQDIEELESMSLDEYKKAFSKNEDFTLDDKIEEVNKFKDKVSIYSDAHNVVKKTFSDIINIPENEISKKLADLLIYSVATEKIYSKRGEEIVKSLVDLNLDLTPEEIEKFAQTSGKVRGLQKEIEDYTAKKQEILDKAYNTTVKDPIRLNLLQALDEKIEKFKADPENADKEYLLEMDADALRAILNEEKSKPEEEQDSNLIKSLEGSLEIQEEKNNIDATAEELAIKTKPRSKYNEESSYNVIKLRQEIEQELEKVNKKLEQTIPVALRSIKKPRNNRLTLEELDEYLMQRKKLEYGLNKKFDSEVILDYIIKDPRASDTNNLIEELAEIYYRMFLAHDIAAELFQLKQNLPDTFAKITKASNWAKLRVAERIKSRIDFLRFNDKQAVYSGEYDQVLQEFEDVIKILQENFIQFFITAKSTEEAQALLNRLNQLFEYLDLLLKERDIVREKEQTQKEASQNAAEQQTKIEADIGKQLGEQADDLAKQEETAQKRKKSSVNKLLEERINNLTIAQQETPNPDPAHPRNTFDELLNNSKIQNKSAVGISLENNKLELEENSYTYKLLKDLNLLDSYNKGLEKLKANPKLLLTPLERLDPDVYIVLRYAPVLMTFYEKVLNYQDELEDKLELTDEEKEKVVHKQYLFLPDDILNDSFKEAIIKYEQEWDALNQEFEAEKAKLDKKKRKEYNAFLRTYNLKFAELETKYAPSISNSTSIYSYKTTLLFRFLRNESSEVILKVNNVNDGDLQNYRSEDSGYPPENHLNEVIDINSLTLDDLYYTDQFGKYVRFTRNPLDKSKPKPLTPDHPFYHLPPSITTGEIFIGYKTKSGKLVPIKLNAGLLSNLENLNVILYNALEFFFEGVSEGRDMTQETFKTGINIIDDLNLNVIELLSLFVWPKRNSAEGIPFLKNTASLYQQKEKGEVKTFAVFELATGEQNSIRVDNLKDLKEQRDAILLNLNNIRFYLNNSLIVKLDPETKEPYLNTDLIKFFADHKLINHSFTPESNHDKIYNASDRKSVTITRINYFTPERRKKRSVGQMLRQLRNSYKGKHGKNNKYEANVNEIINTIRGDIIRKARRNIKKAATTGKLSTRDKKDFIREAVEEVFQEKLNEILSLQEEFINYKDELSFLEKWEKLLLFIQENIFENEKEIENLIKTIELYTVQYDLLNFFKGSNVGDLKMNILKYPDPEKTLRPELQIRSEEQFAELMKIIRVLQDLTNEVDYIFIKYSEDYKGNPSKGPISYAYKGELGEWLPSNQQDKNYWKTRLVRVTIEGTPEFSRDKDGNPIIINGSVFFHVRDFQKDPEDDTRRVPRYQKMVVFADANEPYPDNVNNIVTTFDIPAAIVTNGKINTDELEKLLDSVNKFKVLKKQHRAAAETAIKKGVEKGDIEVEFLRALNEEKKTADISKLASDISKAFGVDPSDTSAQPPEEDNKKARIAPDEAGVDLSRILIDGGEEIKETKETKKEVKEETKESKQATENNNVIEKKVINDLSKYTNDPVVKDTLDIITEEYNTRRGNSAENPTIDENLQQEIKESLATIDITDALTYYRVLQAVYKNPDNKDDKAVAEEIFDQKIPEDEC